MHGMDLVVGGGGGGGGGGGRGTPGGAQEERDVHAIPVVAGTCPFFGRVFPGDAASVARKSWEMEWDGDEDSF